MANSNSLVDFHFDFGSEPHSNETQNPDDENADLSDETDSESVIRNSAAEPVDNNVECQSVTGDTASWTTTYEWSTIENDSTTTDYESFYTSTSTPSLCETVFSITEDERNVDDKSDGGDVDETGSSETTSKESSSNSLRSDDTDYEIMKLPELKVAKPLSVKFHQPTRPKSSPIQKISHPLTRVRRAVSMIDFRNGPNHSDQTFFKVPAKSSSWWCPRRPKVRLGVGCRRRGPSNEFRTNREKRAKNWVKLSHLRVVMSTANVKKDRRILHPPKRLS